MTGFDVYKLYLSVKLHFTSDNYNFFQYNGKSRASVSSYEKRNDKYFFDKLANKYNHDALIDYFVSQFTTQDDMWVGEIVKGKGEKNYYNWRKRKQSLKYQFTTEVEELLTNISEPYSNNFDKLFECKRGMHPQVLKLYLKKQISLETLVILDKILNFVSRLDTELTDPIWINVRNKVIKYSPFLSINTSEYKTVLREKVLKCQSF
jgi:hypothetical protein